MNILTRATETLVLVSRRVAKSTKTGKDYYYLGFASGEGVAEVQATKTAFEDAEKIGQFKPCTITFEYITNYELFRAVQLVPLK